MASCEEEEVNNWRALWEVRGAFREKALAVFRHPSWPGSQPGFGPLEVAGAYQAGIIPKLQLKHGVYYYGSCRNATVAMWNANLDCFEYMRSKLGSVFSETIRALEDDDGFDLFFPVCEIEPDPTEVIK